MGIIFDANEMHTMMNSMNKNMGSKIHDIDDMKKEILSLIKEDSLQGKAYDNGKEYFQMVWIPLLEGISNMCSSTIQGNKGYMNDFHNHVDASSSAYIDTDYLEDGILRLNRLREIMDNDIGKPKWLNNELYDNLYETRQLQNTINQLYDFDASASSHYEDAKYYYDQVKSGKQMLSKGTWDEKSGSFKIDYAAMGWAGNILSKTSNDKEKGGALDKLFKAFTKKFLKSIQKKQDKLVEEYWNADETRKKEIIEELRGLSIFKNICLDYPLHMDYWQLELIGWDKETVNSIDLKEMNEMLDKYNITTIERKRHFFAQITHESSKGLGLTEWGGSMGDAYFDQYEPGTTSGKNIGNTESGDGSKFRGTGYIHLTGRYNYQQFANKMKDQEIVNQGYQYVAENYSWEAAGYFWQDLNNNDINSIIDNGGTVAAVMEVVNKWDVNSLEFREGYYADAIKVIY